MLTVRLTVCLPDNEELSEKIYAVIDTAVQESVPSTFRGVTKIADYGHWHKEEFSGKFVWVNDGVIAELVGAFVEAE